MKWLIAVFAALFFGPACAEQCIVDHCHDGDTCNLRCGVGSDMVRRIKVRLHCIDAPEIGQEPWGRGSAKALRHFAMVGARIELEPLKQDKYGRMVGVLRLNGTILNLEMIRQGFAAVYEKYCTESAYYQAQDEARAARRGIWSQPGVQQRPWEWRHGKAGFIPLPKPHSNSGAQLPIWATIGQPRMDAGPSAKGWLAQWTQEPSVDSPSIDKY